MKVHNIRLGHATNSSSSHSIIFDPGVLHGDDDVGDNFGWNYFTAASEEAKKSYVASMLAQNLRDDFSDALVSAILRGIGLDPGEVPEYGIDHQSLHNLPLEFGSNVLDLQFFEEFKNYLLRDGVVILGGNDNDQREHWLYDGDKEIDLGGWGADQGNVICRKDGDWWTLYSKQTGNRMVFSFNDNPAPFEPETPMLADVKITNYCSFGCSFCYQGSTKEGQHMDTNKMYGYAQMLAEAKVFEVAIGGGEPTQCPDLETFIHYCHTAGIVVNFTTKSTSWLEDQAQADRILPMIGAFAFSASDCQISDLDRIMTIFKYRYYDKKKLTLQIVPAVMNKYKLESVLKWASQNYVRITLLGYKETGRGAKFKEIAINRAWDKFDESTWLTVLDELHQKGELGRISIDTTLASRYLDQLKALGLPDWLYHVEEGKYSVYLDMVQHEIGPSSYHLDKLEPFNVYSDDLGARLKMIEPVV